MCIVILLFVLILYACLSVGTEYGAFAGILAFVATFGVLFLVSEGNQKKQNAKKQVVEDWKSKVIDPILEAQIDEKRKHIDTNSELAAEARKIFLSEISTDSKAISFNLDAKDIILAKHGKLSQYGGAWHGITITEPDFWHRQEESERIIKEQHMIVRWIDKQLRKFGAETELYFSSNDMHYFPAYEAKDTECGTYRWGPTITDDFKFYSRSAADRKIQEWRNRGK